MRECAEACPERIGLLAYDAVAGARLAFDGLSERVAYVPSREMYYHDVCANADRGRRCLRGSLWEGLAGIVRQSLPRVTGPYPSPFDSHARYGAVTGVHCAHYVLTGRAESECLCKNCDDGLLK